MKDYRNLKVWERAHQVALRVYSITKAFPKEEQYNLTSQLRRSAISIPTNIVEGSAKFTDKDFANYLQISLGSTHEVEYLLFFCQELELIDAKQIDPLVKEVGEVKAMLISLIKKVRSN
ncbi:MAG: four helix bundle protein [Flammeovirgaceae bacterium]|nr:four helix bundle protein [Flammeovirgaceae bacterium]